MRVNIHIPDTYMGDITGDLNHKRGRILGMEVEEGMQVVQAEVRWPKCTSTPPSCAA